MSEEVAREVARHSGRRYNSVGVPESWLSCYCSARFALSIAVRDLYLYNSGHRPSNTMGLEYPFS
jgi:hypothetical protein